MSDEGVLGEVRQAVNRLGLEAKLRSRVADTGRAVPELRTLQPTVQVLEYPHGTGPDATVYLDVCMGPADGSVPCTPQQFDNYAAVFVVSRIDRVAHPRNVDFDLMISLRFDEAVSDLLAARRQPDPVGSLTTPAREDS